MNALLLDNVTFWDVIWWMIIAYFFVLIIMMFVNVFRDLFHRDDLNAWAKGGWIAAIVIVPFLAILLYLCFRPRVTPSDREMMARAKQASGYSAAEEIAKAQQLLTSGAITQAEFDTLKAQALG